MGRRRALERPGRRVLAMAFLGPLLVFLIKGNDSAYIRQQSAESLNFQLSMIIYGVVGTLVRIVLRS